MHEGPFSFHAKLPQPDVRVFCPRADCDYSDEMQPVDAAIAETIPCPTCKCLGVTSLAKAVAP